MSEERYDLKASKSAVDELYPVLKDAHGEIIDGFHRKEADPNWHEEVKEKIRTNTQLWLARIIANTHRREVSLVERANQLKELAKALTEENKVPREKIIGTIAELTTFSIDYIRRLLPEEYKQRAGVGGGSHVSVGLSPTQLTVPRGTPPLPERPGYRPNEEEEPKEGAELGTPHLETTPIVQNAESPADVYHIEGEVIEDKTTFDAAKQLIESELRKDSRVDRGFLSYLLHKRLGLSASQASDVIEETIPPSIASPPPREVKQIDWNARDETCPVCGRAVNKRVYDRLKSKFTQMTLEQFRGLWK